MPKHISVFINPKVSNSNALEIEKKIIDYLGKIDSEYDVFRAAWPSTLQASNEAWIIGGDGTLNYFLNKYPDVKIPLAIFKGGTGNDFATHLYGNMTLAEQLEVVGNSSGKRVDAASCNGHYFINSMGVGFDGEVVKAMSSKSFLGTKLGYLLAVIKTILSYRSPVYEINIDGLITQKPLLLVMIANGSTAGGGFTISPESDIRDGKLNLILSSPLPVAKRFKYLPAIKKGKHLSIDFITHELITKLHIRSKNKIAAHLDGEFIEADQFDVKVLPGKYTFKY